MSEENSKIICCNDELERPLSANILSGTCSYFTRKNPILDRKNQDSIGIFANDEKAILIVADGIGGHRMGDEASKIAVSTIIETCAQSKTFDLRTVYEAIIAANKNIRALNVGAGSTLCVGFIEKNELTFLSTGDSIGVHYSGLGNKKTQTVDQSSAGLAKLSHLFDDKDVLSKEGGNQLIFALGDEQIQLSITGPVEMNQRDQILLSSDGLTANLNETEISQMITTGPVNERVIQLVEKSSTAMESKSGHPDDLSIILLSLGRTDSTEDLEVKEKEA